MGNIRALEILDNKEAFQVYNGRKGVRKYEIVGNRKQSLFHSEKKFRLAKCIITKRF